MDEVLSLPQVAALLGVDKMTIYRWEKQGKVPAPKRLQRTNKRLYTMEDVDRLKRYRDAVVDPGTGNVLYPAIGDLAYSASGSLD